MSAEYVTKHIDLDNRVAALLVGENDSHLRALEQRLDCDISLRGNQLALAVPPIVSVSQWLSAQDQCKKNTTVSKRNVVHDYLLRYRVLCGCGHARICHSGFCGGKFYLYYRCATYSNDTVRGKCGTLAFRADQVDALVWDCLKEYFRDPADLRNKLAEYTAAQDKVNAPILSLIKTNEDLIAKNQAELTRIKDMCQAKIITLEEAVDRKTRLEGTVTKLEGERGKLAARLGHRPSDDEIEDVMSFAYDISAGVAKADKSFEKRRKVIELLDVRGILTIEDGEKVCYASFILAQGEYSKRLVLPQRGNALSVATISS